MVGTVLFSSNSAEWSTPQDLFDALDLEFGFTLDAAASDENAKCSRYFTEQTDGLKQDWSKEIAFCNPPYGREISKWVEKAYNESLKGATVVLLLPSRTDTRWFWDYCVKGEIRFLKGRLKFGGAESGAPFPSMLVIFRNHREEIMVTHQVHPTQPAQARIVLELIDSLSEKMERRDCLESDLERIKSDKKSKEGQLETVNKEIQQIELQLVGKMTLPLFSGLSDEEAEDAKTPEAPLEISASVDDESLTVKLVRGDVALECSVVEAEKIIFGFNSETESAVEIAGKINIALQSPEERGTLWACLQKQDEIAFSIDEENQLCRLVKGNFYAETSIERAEEILIGDGPDEYGTFEDLVSAVREVLGDEEERAALWAELEANAQPITPIASDHAQQESESAENVREFFGGDGGEVAGPGTAFSFGEGEPHEEDRDIEQPSRPEAEKIDVLQKADRSAILKRGKERREVKTTWVNGIRNGASIDGKEGTLFLQGEIKELDQEKLAFLFESAVALTLAPEKEAETTEPKPKRTRKPKAVEAVAE